MLKEINPQIVMAAGNKLTGEYWSSSELGTSAWQVDLDTPNYNAKPKNNTYKVRAVLAF